MDVLNIHFTNEMNPSNAAEARSLMEGDRFGIDSLKDYGPKHRTWVEAAESRLINNEAHALLAKVGLVAAGVIFFREDPDDTAKIGIRNLSVNPRYWGRSFATFLEDNATYLAREYYPNATILEIDTKTTNSEMLGFLASRGYAISEVRDLYNSGMPDAILSKSLRVDKTSKSTD